MTSVILTDVPTTTWTYGCAPTSAGMIFGYYDRNGYPNMYTGPCNGGVAPLTDLGQGDDPANPIAGACSIIATQKGFDGRSTNGHVDDYWTGYGNSGPDPWDGNWTEHAWGGCTADYMGSNQWKWDFDGDGTIECNTDGSTCFFVNSGKTKMVDFIPPASEGLPQTEGCHGLRLFAQSRGYTVLNNYTQNISPNVHGGFSFSNYQTEINAGRPVLIQLDGHTMAGVGYDTSGQTVYVHDTWDNSTHSMTWGGSYSGMAQWGVTVLQLAAPTNLAPVVVMPADPNLTLAGGSASILLSAAVTDDGLPTGSTVSITWSRISGPAAVTFGSPGAAATTATFTAAGSYTLKCLASDSLLSSEPNDTMTVTVNPPANLAPVVVMPADPNLTLAGGSASILLSAAVTDDGLPTGSTVTITWGRVSGPAAVTFGSPGAAATTATFTAAGSYTLKCLASDSLLSSEPNDTMMVTVNAPTNLAPVVVMPADPNLTMAGGSASILLSAAVTDDGLPTGSTVSITWSRISGPAAVTFGSPGAAATTATFTAAGSYTLKCLASDSLLSSEPNDTMMVTVNPPAGNVAPVVAMPANLAISMPDAATPGGVALNASVSDDGQISPLVMTWSILSAPQNGTVNFTNGNSASTTASFTRIGAYQLQLDANDGALHSWGTMMVTVGEDSRADFNNSGAVDGTDFLTWQRNYNHGTAASGAVFVDANFADPNYARAHGDANGDGKVDGQDYLIWQQDYVFGH